MVSESARSLPLADGTTPYLAQILGRTSALRRCRALYTRAWWMSGSRGDAVRAVLCAGLGRILRDPFDR